MKELALRNAQVMEDAMSRRFGLMEEKNAMVAFSMYEGESEKGKQDRAEFFRLTSAAYFRSHPPVTT